MTVQKKKNVKNGEVVKGTDKKPNKPTQLVKNKNIKTQKPRSENKPKVTKPKTNQKTKQIKQTQPTKENFKANTPTAEEITIPCTEDSLVFSYKTYADRYVTRAELMSSKKLYRDFGFDSLDAAAIVVELEKIYNIKILTADVNKFIKTSFNDAKKLLDSYVNL